MSLLTSISNKIQYSIAKSTSDPEADAYAKQQAEQAKQDAEVAKRKAEVDAKDKAAADKKAKDDAKAADIAARSKFDMKKLVSDSAKGIIGFFIVLAILSFTMYGGHVAANQNMGYSVIGRIIAFLYGNILSLYIVPKAIIDVYWHKKTLPYYAFLPVSTHVPQGTFEEIFMGPFCYQADDASAKARVAVGAAYAAGVKREL
jgi:hypothetical protein